MTCCPICSGGDIELIQTLPQQPTHVGIVYPTPDKARGCTKGDVTLMGCTSCGHAFNIAFDPSLMSYDEEYNNALDHSAVFRDYQDQLIDELLHTQEFPTKRVIEIGCGNGQFLELLCERGELNGFGFDPAASQAVTERVTFFPSTFTQAHCERYHADLVCCRHVLEHIQEPLTFVETLRDASLDRLYLEVPNGTYVLSVSPWDLIYEHCHYFSEHSLRALLARAGLAVLSCRATYSGQFLSVQAHRQKAPEGPTGGFASWDKSRELRNTLAEWNEWLESAIERKKRIALWGAGGKGVGFCNLLPAAAAIACIVDINPHKQGKYMAGTGQPIVAPAYLRDNPPDCILLTNPKYRNEISQQLAEMGLSVDLYDVTKSLDRCGID